MNRTVFRCLPAWRRCRRGFAMALAALVATHTAWAQPLKANPNRVDFGTLKVGARRTVAITVQNAGSEAIDLEAALDGGVFTVAPATVHLAGGQQQAIEVAFSATAAGAYRGQLQLATRGFLAGQRLAVPLQGVAAAASVIVVPDSTEGLSFGAVAVGDTARQSLVVSNGGEVPVVIDSATLEVADGVFSVRVPPHAVVPPGERLAIEVRFAPSAGEHRENRVLLLGPDLTPMRQRYPVRGDGLVADAVFSPLPDVGLAYGDVALGDSRTLELTILNRGQADLRVTRIEITSGAFGTPWDAETAPAIRPGQRLAIPVTYHPTAEGRSSGRLIVHTNANGRALVEIPLQGSGRGVPPQLELLNEDRLDFGNVTLGRQERDHVLLWNRGGAPFTASLQVEGEAAEDYAVEAPSAVVQPGEVRKVPVRFRPREKGDRWADLLVTTETANRRVALRGVGKFLELSPMSIDFDRVVVGKTGTLQATVHNLGNSDFTVTNVVSTNPIFTAKSPVRSSARYVLQADSLKALPVTLGFTPPGRGDFTGVLQLQGYWDETLETREILLNGTGIAADLELYPAGPYEFDYVVLGHEQVQAVVATNTGDTDLRVEAHSESPEFRVEPTELSLGPGQAANLKIVFVPAGLGNRSGTVRVISNDVRERALALQVRGKGALDNIDLAQVVRVVGSRKGKADSLGIKWTNTPMLVPDETKVDVVFRLPPEMRAAMVGRRFSVEWTQLDAKYDEQGSPQKTEVEVLEAGEERVLADRLNLRLTEAVTRRVRLRVTTQNYPGAPTYGVSQLLEAGGWKWEFEAKPLVSVLSIRPSRRYHTSVGGRDTTLQGETERLVGLPGFAFFGYHNSENPSVSGIHLTATGNVLEALSTENSIAVSLGFSLSLYKDRFMFGLGWDVYDHRPRARRRGTADYITTFKYWGLF